MIVGSISENIKFEKRVAITPDIIKKYKSLGLEVHLSKDYGLHLGINDNHYEKEGATISSNDEIKEYSDLGADAFLVGETLSLEKELVNGISICLKKGKKSVVKIWNNNKSKSDIEFINKEILNKWGTDIIYIQNNSK